MSLARIRQLEEEVGLMKRRESALEKQARELEERLYNIGKGIRERETELVRLLPEVWLERLRSEAVLNGPLSASVLVLGWDKFPAQREFVMWSAGWTSSVEEWVGEVKRGLEGGATAWGGVRSREPQSLA